MSDIDQMIQAKITQFVAELHSLVREAALEAVTGALGGRAATAHRPASVASKPASKGPAKAPAAPRAQRVKGQKRAPEEIARTVERLAGSIAAKGGQRIEHIAKSLGLHTDDLALPVSKLLAANRIRKTGQRRGTRYFGIVKAKK